MKAELTNGNRKIDQALHLLGEAAKEKKETLQKSLTRQFSNIKDVLEEKGGEVKKAANQVDQKVHKNPWAYIGGAAALAALTGYIFGVNRRK